MTTGVRPPDVDTVDETVTIGDRVLSVVRPRSGQVQLGEEAFGNEVVMPYWAEMWPSGVALARGLVGRPLRGVRTLELGCGGLALPSIVASLGGARVLATDWSADAVAFAERNARRSRAPVETAVCSWAEPDPIESRAPWSLVLAADVLYEQQAADHLAALLPRLVGTHGSAWIADPAREPATRFLEAAAERFEIETATTDFDRVLLHRLRPTEAG
ncbi:MAG: class I SAM-dependent methyltransferase [Thermoleophilaceae bacterium]|jgi:predicted nicotinamide N-methyase